MKRLWCVVIIWFITISIIFQIITVQNSEVFNDEIIRIENEMYNNLNEIKNLKIELKEMKNEVKEHQEQTERLFDQNLKLITEGGWDEFTEYKN